MHNQLSPLKIPKSQSFLKKKAYCAKSREELLEESHDIIQPQSQFRRTKIIGTISDKQNTYEKLKDLIKAGLNIFTINMAYCTTKTAEELKKYRDQLEKELNKQIPIICTLKGSLIRIGLLQKPQIYLKKGQQYRLILRNNILGNDHYCGIDEKELGQKIKIGDTIIIDYGQISMGVLKIEKSCESIKYLKENCGYLSDEFQEVESHSKKLINQQCQIIGSSQTQIEGDFVKNVQKGDFYCIYEDENNDNLFAQKFKQNKKKEKNYKVIVCQIDNDCLLRSHKPLFIYQKKMPSTKSNFILRQKLIENIKENQREQIVSSEDEENFKEQEFCEDDDDYYDDDQEFITPKDINDISWCVDNNIDCICISNVQSSKNLKAVKNIIGKNKNSISLIARIQSKEAVENIEEIIKESDGIQIARGYLTIHMPVEKLFVQQREMIKKCHEYMKPVLISCNILNSMVSSLLPSMSEIGEISNLVNEYVDGIILSSETSCSTNPVEAIKTLEKVCIEAENIRILDSIYKFNSSQQLRSAKTTIQSCIIECAIQTAFNINAKFIFAFTTRGYTALKISKMRPYCPILAITSDKRVARILTCVCGIQSLLIESLIGTEFIMKQIINIQKNEGKLFPGDFVVITYGDIEDKANQTNNIKVIIVE